MLLDQPDRAEEALSAADQTVAVLAPMADFASYRDGVLPDLAYAHWLRTRALTRLDRLDDAVAAGRQAVELLRVAAASSASHAWTLVTALELTCDLLADAQEHAEALALAVEAVEAAERTGEPFLQLVALWLHSRRLLDHPCEPGDWDDTRVDELLSAYSTLVEHAPDPWLGELVVQLMTLQERLADLTRVHDAATAVTLALTPYEKLVAADPGWTPAYCHALGVYAELCLRSGAQDQTLAVAEHHVAVASAHDHGSAVHARAQETLATCLDRVGRAGEAEQASRAAVDLWTALAEANDDDPDVPSGLAHAWNTLANRLSGGERQPPLRSGPGRPPGAAAASGGQAGLAPLSCRAEPHPGRRRPLQPPGHRHRFQDRAEGPAPGADRRLASRGASRDARRGARADLRRRPGAISSGSRERNGAVRDGQEAGRKEFPRQAGLDRLDDATAGQEQRREFLKEKGAVSRVRGMLLGLALGDTLGAARGKLPADGPLRARVSTQLACFTAEGTIRALVRGDHKGICGPPGVVWHAYCRWAALQGIEAERMRQRWAHSDNVWPDGWLAQVPVLAERRGSAPATVAALSKIEQGTDGPPTTSRGRHALTRTFPLAVAAAGNAPGYWVGQAREVAALTHGDRAAQSAAAHATVLVKHCMTSEGILDALQAGLSALPSLDGGGTDAEHSRLTAAFRQALDQPADQGRLARLAPDATSPSALLGGLYVAASFPDRADLGAALRFAAGAPDGDSVACVTGALLGAVHGVEALPVDLVSRHELAWVLDTLARDLVAQLTDSPSGGEYTLGWDPHWWDRYPGW